MFVSTTVDTLEQIFNNSLQINIHPIQGLIYKFTLQTATINLGTTRT